MLDFTTDSVETEESKRLASYGRGECPPIRLCRFRLTASDKMDYLNPIVAFQVGRRPVSFLDDPFI